MKALKFRIWDLKDEIMLPVSSLIFKDGLSRIRVEKDGMMVEFKPEDVEIMQSTGIMDCDGTELYEGDIVKVLGKQNQLFGYIWYNGYHFTINLYNVPGADNWPILKEENIRSMDVIGNIYKDKCLLEPKDE